MVERIYRHCELVKGCRVQVAWIPDKYAVLHAYVKLKDGSAWEDGWRVTWVSTTELTEAERIKVGEHDVFASI